jgi:hypothetical protein
MERVDPDVGVVTFLPCEYVVMKVIRLGAWCDHEAVAEFRRVASFRVHEFAELADGRRLTLNTDRGFSLSGPLDIWAKLTLETLEADVRTTVLPDEDTGEEHPWDWPSERLRALGVDVSPEQLRELPYEVEFSERLRARMS